MPNTDYVQSFAVPNYSGALFAKGNTATPFISMIAGKTKYTTAVKFVLGQEYTTEEGAIPAISEDASVSGVTATYITTAQKYNVTQIFMEAVAISYAKMSNTATLGGVNIAGQIEQPVSQLDFQVANKLKKIARSLEKSCIQGTFSEATTDVTINKTRGMNEAIVTNTLDIDGRSISIWDINEIIGKIHDAGGETTNLTFWCDGTTLNQLNADCINNGLTVAPANRNENGISVTKLMLPQGDINIVRGEFIPSGTAYIFNFDFISPVEQNVPNKGNFFLEMLAKTGAGEKWQIFGQFGLDYGMEWMHGKISNIKTTFNKPTSVQGTYTVTSAAITLTFDNNNASATGAASPATVAATVGVDSAVRASAIGTMALSGYTFLGWATSSSATAIDYASGDDITIGSTQGKAGLSASTTLYAVWEQNT